MNIDLLLEQTDFSLVDKARIGVFLTPLFTNFQVTSIEYEQTDYANSVIVKAGTLSYYFIRRKNETDVTLFLYDEKKDHYIDYTFHKSYIPIRVYRYIDGDLTGKGNGERNRVQRNLFLTAYLDSKYKLDIAFNGSNKSVSSITVYLQVLSLVKQGRGLKLDLINHYFSIDTKTAQVMKEHAYKPSFYNTVFNEHRSLQCRKNKYSTEFADVFMASVKVTGNGVDVYSNSGRQEIRDFMTVVEMMMI